MSFRSRTRSTQPIMPRRRSLSNSRVPTNTSYGSSLYSNGNLGSNYSIRPLSTGYYPGNTAVYQSPYSNHYGSRENLLYSSPRSGHYGNGNSVRDSYPKKSNSFNTSGMYDKRYGALTSYGSDRYISPYSSYENGVTTAGFNINLNKSYPSKNTYTSSSNSNSSKKRDYTPVRNTSLSSTTPLSNSNSSLNSYSLSKPTKVSTGTNTPAMIINRSQSLREQERKSRSRTRNRQAAARSLSASSEKSEGYESGSERTSRSRLGSTSSLAASEKGDSKIGNSSANGDVIDYKALWEAAKVENEKLKELLKKKDDEIQSAKAAVERFTNATSKNSLSELEKRERRAMERKLSEMEEELKLLQKLKTENERLRAENRALTRVVSKLTTSAQNQLQKKQ